MATPLGTLWTRRLQDADKQRSEGESSWLAAAVQSDCHFNGIFDHPNHSGQPITKNKQFAATRTIHAAVVPKTIRVEAKPIRPMDTEAANLMETLLRWNLHVADVNEVVDFVELDGQVKGVGISYVGWRAAITPEITSESGQDEAVLTDKKGEADEGMWDAWERALPHRLNGANLSRVFHIDPYDYLQDPIAKTRETAGWAAHRMWMTKKDIDALRKAKWFEQRELTYVESFESSKRFSRVEDEGEHGGAQESSSKLDEGDEDHFKIWEVWQVHDFKEGTVLWIIPGMEEPARDPRPNPHGNPYQDYRPNRTGGEFWSKPDSWIYAPAQKRLDQLVDSSAELVNMMAKPAWLYDIDAATDETDMTSLANLKPGQHLGVPGQLLSTMRRVNEDTRIPDSFMQLMGMLESVVTETSAVSEIASGSLGGAGVTATAANLSAGSQSLRSGYNRRVLNTWIKEVVRRMAFVLQKLFTPEDAIPILGSKAASWQADADPGVVEIEDRSQLDGMMDFQIHAGDEAREVQVEDRKMAMDMLQISGAMAATGQVQVDMQGIFRWALDKLGIPTELAGQNAPPQIPMPQQGPVPTQNVGGGPNSGTPTQSQGVANPDSLNRDRAPAAAAMGGAAKRV
jgi:hypothetical protein